MASFANPVAIPPTSAYGPQSVDFGILGDLYNTYQNSERNKLAIDQQREQLAQQQKLRTLFQGGLPTDPRTGQLDLLAVTQALAKAGDIGAIGEFAPLIQKQADRNVTSPLIPGVGDLPPTAGPPPAQSGAPASAPGSPTQGPSIVDIVAGKLGDENAGPMIGRVATAMGINPNQPLTAGQQKRAQGLLSRYAPDTGATAPVAPAVAPAAPTAPATSFNARFAQLESAPSVGAPPLAPPVTPAAPAPAPVAPVAGPQAAPAAPQPQPIGPQVPLPKDPRTGRPFTDPEQAILALQSEAGRIGSQNPVRAKFLNDWAARIEKSLEPMPVRPGEILLSKRTGQPIFSATSGLSTQAARDAAMTYVQTGKFPPNMGRGIQGEQTRNQILELAAGIENELGLDPADRAARWQAYATHAAGLRTLEQRAANLTLVESETKTLIPRVRALIDKVPRTQYPDLNRIIQIGEEKTGDPNVVRLGIAVSSLAPVYARLLKPTGTIGVTDTENAKHILSQYWSSGQMNQALDQMEIERAAAKKALDSARKEFGASGAVAGREQESSASSQPVQKWERGPDGKLRPAQ